MIHIENLSFSYDKKTILSDIHFHAKHGEIISLIGPNGSGKSTLLRLMCGLLKANSGKIEISNKSIDRYKQKELSKFISFLPQFHEKMNGVTVYELVAMGRSPYHKSGWINTKEDKEKIEWAICYMNLTSFKDKKVEELSGGERQRVWIAMILAQDTPIVLLDEPVTYMDMKYQCQLLSVVRDLKKSFRKTIISVFHDINHAVEISDKVYLLKDGRVYFQGDSDNVITEENIENVYGVKAHVCKLHRCCRNVVVPTV